MADESSGRMRLNVQLESSGSEKCKKKSMRQTHALGLEREDRLVELHLLKLDEEARLLDDCASLWLLDVSWLMQGDSDSGGRT